jgi:Protein of unknown function (DUF3667)
MSHRYLRTDKNCLNCGAIVPERYCSHCGQENTEPKESFKHLIGHFFADFTHYDSQFFITIKDLIFKPGFLTKEYNAGRRYSYLNPIRMYIFISAVFFLVIFSQKKEENIASNATTAKHDVNLFRQHLADSLRGIVKSASLSQAKDSAGISLYKSLAANLDTIKTSKDTGASFGAYLNNHGVVTFQIQETRYATTGEYEAKEHKLPESARDGAVVHYIERKMIRLIHERGHANEVVLTNDVAHDIPKIMFVLLPLFALFTRFFYSRRKFFYGQHAIFSLHFHSFVFIIFLLVSLVGLAVSSVTAAFILLGSSSLAIFVYLAIALHKACQQALWLSFVKAFAISVLYTLAIILSIVVVIAGSFIFL